MSSQPKSEEVLTEYRRALHRGEDVSVEEVADKIPVYALGKAQPVGSVTVALPIAPQITQQTLPPISGMISGVFLSGIMPMNRLPWGEAQEDEEQKKERLNNMGNKVLRHVNAHDTTELGQLSDTIRERLQYLKDSASFSNQQWKAFAELSQAINDMIGDPYDPKSTESD